MEGAKAIFASLNPFDYLLLAIFAFFFIKSLVYGFSRELASLVGLILGLFLAGRFYYLVAKILSPWLSNQLLITGLSFITVFLIVYLSFFILGVLLRRTLALIRLAWLDRLLGGALGLLKATVAAAILVILLVSFIPRGERLLNTSRLYPYLQRITEVMVLLLPKDLKARFKYRLRHSLPAPRAGERHV
ncbi:CvpA family protein [Thermosulfuriphilus ammonigenes]|uniref:CvpA family protein n=1 Tax=Thermosulfuriphilus ammonigenes TaxID=1936021 RepID=A0A6G7PWT1_9BACT|nr:CvpA family protein [Thermosulfuriphilus ammonigenes]MBA2847748.1 membrane protein required for colicin V production [Thermosulfuriphilus ammonigenes]QIJ72047.1 CvpA family protein [Thermosulfuriphilus ammonigenes]HFB83229.1 CvpA family protein [Thermodesulfatator sp.]